jgi:hypothetical protein
LAATRCLQCHGASGRLFSGLCFRRHDGVQCMQCRRTLGRRPVLLRQCEGAPAENSISHH